MNQAQLEDEIEVMIDPETEVRRAHSAGRRELAEQLLHMFRAVGGKPRAVNDQLHAVCTAEMEGTPPPTKHKRELRTEPTKGQTPDRVGVAPVAKTPRTGEEAAEEGADARPGRNPDPEPPDDLDDEADTHEETIGDA